MPEPRGNVATSSWLYVLLLSLIWWNIYWINEFVCSWVWIFPTYTYPTGKIHTQLPVWRLKKKNLFAWNHLVWNISELDLGLDVKEVSSKIYYVQNLAERFEWQTQN